MGGTGPLLLQPIAVLGRWSRTDGGPSGLLLGARADAEGREGEVDGVTPCCSIDQDKEIESKSGGKKNLKKIMPS